MGRDAKKGEIPHVIIRGLGSIVISGDMHSIYFILVDLFYDI